MFVTADDFNTRPYKLPNLDNAHNAAEFDNFVEEWATEWWPKIFGRTFYDKMVEGVVALPSEWDANITYTIDQDVVEGYNVYKALVDNLNSKPTATNINWLLVEEGNRWLRLIKGYPYLALGTSGTKYNWAGLIKAEKLAVFSKWLAASVNDVSGVAGNVTADVENSTLASSAQDIANAWNKFARLIGGRTRRDKIDTLYGYLLAINSAEGTFDDTFDETFTSFVSYMASEFGWPGRFNQFNF